MSDVWNKRLRRDFPYIVKRFPEFGKENAKSRYLELFQRFSKMAETFTEVILNEYGELQKFLTPDFKKFLYENFYDLCTSAIRKVLKDNYDEELISDSILDVFFNSKFSTFKRKYFPGMKDDEERFNEYWQDAITLPLEDFVKELMIYLKT